MSIGVSLASVVTGPVWTAQNSTPAGPRQVELPLATLTPDATVALDLAPGAVATGDAVWVPHLTERTVHRVDAKTNALSAPLTLPHVPCGSMTLAFETLWIPLCEGIPNGAGTRAPRGVVRADPKQGPKQGNVSAEMPLPIHSPRTGLAIAAGSVWSIADRQGVVSRIDPATNAAVAEAYVAAMPQGIAAADDTVWVTSEAGNLLTRINAHTNVVTETIKVGPRPGPLAIGEGAVWILNRGDGSVSRVDPMSNKLVTTIVVGESVRDGEIAVGEGALWLSAVGAPLIRIDARTNRVTQRFTGSGGGAIVVGHGSVWIAAGAQLTWRLDPKLVASMRP